MNRFLLKIDGMDCAEEIAILRRALSPYIDNDEQLGFDLLNGKLTVETDNSGLDENTLIRAITETGMHATSWQAYTAKGNEPTSFWSKNNRQIMTTLSAVFLALGYLTHAIQHGFMNALFSDETAGYSFPTISIALYSLAIIIGGWHIFPKAWYALRHFRPDMNLLMSIAVIGAATIGQWSEAATVTFLFSLALLLESWSIGRARQAIRALLALTPNTARVISLIDGTIEEKPMEEIKINDTLTVRPGEKIPLDGILTKGITHINQAPITGESMPIPKEADDEVFAGTINCEGAIEIKVTKLSQDTTLAHITKRIEEAQAHRAPSEQWVDKFARIYTPLMLVLAILVVLIPPLLFDQSWSRWFYEGLVILVIACPCALVISTPVSIVAGLSSAARAGVLIKGGAYLELPARIKAIALDKTGTLTQGKPEVEHIIPLNQHTQENLLQIAASLESYSEHPIAHAICKRAKLDNITTIPVEHYQAIKGRGGEGRVDGKLYWIGSHRLLHEKVSESIAKDAHAHAQSLEESSQTVIILGQDDHVCGLIGVADTIREEAKAALLSLKEAGVSTIMLTGDNEGTAKYIAKKVGINEFHSQLLPEDKIKHVRLLADKFKVVAMIGDGVNDAPAMASASLGIAMGAIGSDATIETADISLMTDDLKRIPWLIEHSRRTIKIIKENIIFSISIKAVFIVLALLGVATLWMAIAADMGASLVVIFNGLRLLRSRPETF